MRSWTGPTNMRGWMLVLATLSCAMAGCKRGGGEARTASATRPQPPAAAGQRASSGGAGAAPIAWIEDDYAAALAQARSKRQPLVIDMWASWCHTCLSMKHGVLADPALRSFAQRLVWVSLDTERPENAPALQRFPVRVWPTFLVVDPRDQTVLVRQVGSASVREFQVFLEAGLRGFSSGEQRAGASRQHWEWARAADRAATRGRHAEADEAYGKALQQAPASWPRRAAVLVAQIGARHAAGRWADCVDLGLQSSAQTGWTAAAADFLAYAVDCAGHLERTDARRHRLFELAARRLAALVDHRAAKELAADDRSEALRILRETLDHLGRKAQARQAAQRQLELLDAAAKRAPSAAAAATFNWPRAEVYVYLGRGAELVPALQASQRALPREYDPPYRLAWVQLQLGQHDHALSAAKRALALVYGPRKARVEALIAQIHRARGSGGNSDGNERPPRARSKQPAPSAQPGCVEQCIGEGSAGQRPSAELRESCRRACAGGCYARCLRESRTQAMGWDAIRARCRTDCAARATGAAQ